MRAENMTPLSFTESLNDLARRVSRLAPSHRDPERFHEEKSEIAHALRKLANGKPEGVKHDRHQ